MYFGGCSSGYDLDASQNNDYDDVCTKIHMNIVYVHINIVYVHKLCLCAQK